MSGIRRTTFSRLTVLPRPVRRPSSGSSAYRPGRKGRASGLGALVQPSIFSGASVYRVTEAGGPAGNTRFTLSGTSILRLLESVKDLAAAGDGANTSPAIAAAVRPKRSRRLTWRPSHRKPL